MRAFWDWLRLAFGPSPAVDDDDEQRLIATTRWVERSDAVDKALYPRSQVGAIWKDPFDHEAADDARR